MDFIKECFEKYGGTFAEKLQEVGFSTDQASQFLPETASAIMQRVQDTGIEKTMAVLLSEEPTQLLNFNNIEDIAKKLGMNSVQVTTGLEAITPVMSKVLSQKNKDLVGTAASLDWGSTAEITSSVKNFLFNK